MKNGAGRDFTLNQLLLRLISLRLFVPLVVINLAVFVGAGYRGEKRIKEEQHLMTDSIARMVEGYLDHASRALDALTRASEFSTPDQRALLMNATLAAYGQFQTLYSLDKETKITLITPPQTRYLGLDMSNLSYFRGSGVIDNKSKVIISRPFISIRTGEPTVYLMKRLPDGEALVGELSLGSLQREITHMKKSIANTLVYILDQTGTLLAHPSANMVKEQTNFGNLEIFHRGLQGDISLIFNNGQNWVLGSASRMEQAGWVVVTQVPLSVAIAPYAWTLGFLLLASLTIWLALAWNLREQLRQRVVTPLVRFSQLTNALATGDFDENADQAVGSASFAELDRLAADFRNMGNALKEREDSLRESEERYRSLFNTVPAGLFRTTLDGRIIDFNPASLQMLEYTDKESLLHVHSSDLWAIPEERTKWVAAVEKNGTVRDFEAQMRRRDGTTFWARLNTRLVQNSGTQVPYLEGIMEDITERKRAEEEKARLEEQLRQSQKMESIGLLAGGVAHDFNNLLTPILGYCEMLITEFLPGDPHRNMIERIQEAADRAQELIKRLLAFSRKQLIELRPVDLGDVIRHFENVLNRTIHESIRIVVKISPTLGLVRADKGQLELALLNLSINAQDAMPDGGTLMIEAQEIDLDELYTSRHPEIAPGSYVMLSVSDTGIGMDATTIEHIFEPFFTTKEVGKGTGLGLSTVYGIVKQHGGSITVYSEKDMGSTFKIFLPRLDGKGKLKQEPTPLTRTFHYGNETILVAEDNVMVRELVFKTLTDLGYRVLAAESPTRCIELAKELKTPIHLLITDVVMPEMNGRQLFERILHEQPEMKVLFMSGYTINVIGHHGILDEGVHLIQKPFSIYTLSQKVRQVLDSKN